MKLNQIPFEYFQPRQALRTGMAVLIALMLQHAVLAGYAQTDWLIIGAVFLPQMMMGLTIPWRLLSMLLAGLGAVMVVTLGGLSQTHFWLAGGFLALVMLGFAYFGVQYRRLRVISFYSSVLAILSVGLPVTPFESWSRGVMLLMALAIALIVSLFGVRTMRQQLRYQMVLTLCAIMKVFLSIDHCMTDEDYYHHRQHCDDQILKRQHRVLSLLRRFPQPTDEASQKAVSVLHTLFYSVIAFGNVRFRYHTAYPLLALRDALNEVRNALVAAGDDLNAILRGNKAEPNWSALTAAVQHLQAAVEGAYELDAGPDQIDWVFEEEADEFDIVFDADPAFALQTLGAVAEAQLDLLQQLFMLLSPNQSGGAS